MSRFKTYNYYKSFKKSPKTCEEITIDNVRGWNAEEIAHRTAGYLVGSRVGMSRLSGH